MQPASSYRYLLLAIVAGALGSGCQHFYTYQPLAVLARDAETKQPIPGASVHLSYPLAPSAYAPSESSATTGKDGLAEMRASAYGAAGLLVEVNAPGYLFENKNTHLDDSQIKQAGPFAKPAKPGPPLVVELFAEPRPSVELVVPTGYHGMVVAKMHVREDEPCTPGKRLFSYAVPPTGVVEISGPHLLCRVFAVDFIARYADGTALNRNPKDWDVGFHPLDAEEGVYKFVVGTKFEYDDYAREYRKDQGQAVAPSKAGQPGGRRGGHKDGPPGRDPGDGT